MQLICILLTNKFITKEDTMVLAAVLSMVRYVGDIENRDFVDRMHSYFTTNILVAFAIIVSFKVTSFL